MSKTRSMMKSSDYNQIAMNDHVDDISKQVNDTSTSPSVYVSDGKKPRRHLYIIPIALIILAGIYLYMYIYNYFQEACFIIEDDINLIQSNNTIHRIILFGDSLIQKPTDFYHLDCYLLNRVKLRFPHLRFELLSDGQGGCRIEKLRKKLSTSVIENKPEAVIMHWDSDVSDPSLGYIRSRQGINDYKNNLIDVVQTIKETPTIKYFAISGPEVLGELPDGKNKRDPYLNMYRNINRQVAMDYNVSFIDIRQAFLNEGKRFGWLFHEGYLTFDSEHPSQIGSKLEEDLFFNQIVEWYSEVDS